MRVSASASADGRAVRKNLFGGVDRKKGGATKLERRQSCMASLSQHHAKQSSRVPTTPKGSVDSIVMVKQRFRKKYASCDMHEQWLSIQGMNAFLCYAGYRSLRSRLHHVAETPASLLCRIPLVTESFASRGRDTCCFVLCRKPLVTQPSTSRG